MSDYKKYKWMEPDYNVQAAVENLRKAYWSNETKKVAKIFTDAEDIIISSICHHGYTVCKETTVDTRPQGNWLITDAWPHNVYCSNCYETYAQADWEIWKDGSLPRAFCPTCGAQMKSEDKK